MRISSRPFAVATGLMAAGAFLVSTAPAAMATTEKSADVQESATLAGDNAYAQTSDKRHTGKVKFYHKGDKLKVCDSRNGYYAQGKLWVVAGSGSHETWTKIDTLNANNGCKTVTDNLREGMHIKVQVVNQKKGSSHEYSKSGFGDGHA